ncbi:MAG: GNAT family N-acetyltransferase [Bacillota bacterium]|nr:GNAT family N-acetyltransferase [Bacillota bacterium]
MEIRKISSNKKEFLDLLLLADEQEDMIDRYLEDGEMFALYDCDLKSVCVVVQVDAATYELKNLATYEKYQGRGYGKALVKYILQYYQDRCNTMIVGTGESPLTIPFYERCGFRISHRVKNFFTDNYDHPIFEAGKQLVDMIYLKKDL